MDSSCLLVCHMTNNTCILICITFEDSINTHVLYKNVSWMELHSCCEIYVSSIIVAIAVIIVFTFIEPGYYEDGKFGVRIENLVLVVKAETKVLVFGLHLQMVLNIAYSDIEGHIN